MNVRYMFFVLFPLMTTTVCADDVLEFVLPNVVVPNACVYENTGVYDGSFIMVPVYEDIIYNCGRGYYLPESSEECVKCLENSYCPGGEYTYSETVPVGITACPDGSFAPDGMWEYGQCGRILHVGGSVLYLTAVKKTTPALNVDLNYDGVPDLFGNMTTHDVPMNRNTNKRLKVKLGDVIYFVYDDTVDVTEFTNE